MMIGDDTTIKQNPDHALGRARWLDGRELCVWVPGVECCQTQVGAIGDRPNVTRNFASLVGQHLPRHMHDVLIVPARYDRTRGRQEIAPGASGAEAAITTFRLAMNERLLVAVGQPKSAVSVSASSGQAKSSGLARRMSAVGRGRVKTRLAILERGNLFCLQVPHWTKSDFQSGKNQSQRASRERPWKLIRRTRYDRAFSHRFGRTRQLPQRSPCSRIRSASGTAPRVPGVGIYPLVPKSWFGARPQADLPRQPRARCQRREMMEGSSFRAAHHSLLPPVSAARRLRAAAAYWPRGLVSCTCGRTTVS